MRVTVTGAVGFIGRATCQELRDKGHQPVAFVRAEDSRARCLRDQGCRVEVVGDLTRHRHLSTLLDGVECVVHLAGRAHILSETNSDPLSAFREVNRDATLYLGRAAADAGVRRFVFISSIGVNGNLTSQAPFSEESAPAPHDLYAVSKLEAEMGLREIAAHSTMDFVILRPPLVYGPCAPGNFGRLMALISRGWPLPFGSIDNRRSLLYLGNLVDAIHLCLMHPWAANKTYLLSDGEDVSTPELVRRLAQAMGQPARLLPVPPRLLELTAHLVGKGQEVQRLLDSLAVDSGKIRRELGWQPPYSMEEGLAETAAWYRASRKTTQGQWRVS